MIRPDVCIECRFFVSYTARKGLESGGGHCHGLPPAVVVVGDDEREVRPWVGVIEVACSVGERHTDHPLSSRHTPEAASNHPYKKGAANAP